MLQSTAGISPVAVAAYRLLVGGALVTLVVFPRLNSLWTPKALLGVAFSGALIGGFQAAYQVAVSLVGVSLSTLITIGCVPVFVALVSAVRARRVPGRRTVLAVGGSVVGLVLLCGGPSGLDGWRVAGGVTMSLLAGIGFAVLTLVTAGQQTVTAGREAAGRRAERWRAGGREAAGQGVVGLRMVAAGSEAAGRQVAGWRAGGREAVGQRVAGRRVIAAAGAEAAGRWAAEQQADGDQAARHEVTGWQAEERRPEEQRPEVRRAGKQGAGERRLEVQWVEERRTEEQRVEVQRAEERQTEEQWIGEQRVEVRQAGKRRPREQRVGEQGVEVRQAGERRPGERQAGEQRVEEWRVGELAVGERRAGKEPAGKQQAAGQQVVTSVGLLLGGLYLLPFALLDHRGMSIPLNGTVLVIVGFLGVVPTAVAYGAFFLGLRHAHPTAAALATMLEPLTATVLAVLLNGERLSSAGFLGALLIGGALALYYLTPADH